MNYIICGLAITAAPIFGVFAGYGMYQLASPELPEWFKMAAAITVGLSVAGDRIVHALTS